MSDGTTHFEKRCEKVSRFSRTKASFLLELSRRKRFATDSFQGKISSFLLKQNFLTAVIALNSLVLLLSMYLYIIRNFYNYLCSCNSVDKQYCAFQDASLSTRIELLKQALSTRKSQSSSQSSFSYQ